MLVLHRYIVGLDTDLIIHRRLSLSQGHFKSIWTTQTLSKIGSSTRLTRTRWTAGVGKVLRVSRNVRLLLDNCNPQVNENSKAASSKPASPPPPMPSQPTTSAPAASSSTNTDAAIIDFFNAIEDTQPTMFNPQTNR